MSQSHTFTIIVNNESFETDQHELTGSQIKALARIPPDYELFRVEGSQTKPVGNDEQVHIHEKLHSVTNLFGKKKKK